MEVDSWDYRLMDALQRWWDTHCAIHPPERLIDPEGEGVYMGEAARRSFLWLHRLAYEMGVTDDEGHPDWRALNYEGVYMREDADGLWHRTKWGLLDGFKLPRWAPVYFAYITPPHDPWAPSPSTITSASADARSAPEEGTQR